MKIGIITLTGSDNYGNILQNFAIQKILTSLGVQPETIYNKTKHGHYKPKDKSLYKLMPSYIKRYIYNQLNYRYNIKNTSSGILKTFLFYISNQAEIIQMKEKRKEAFESFRKEFIFWADTPIDNNHLWKKEKVDQYDFFITGSDQVWNPTYPNTSAVDFLQFVPSEKRIALSPSFGVDAIPDELKKKYSCWLEGIPYLSIREERGKKIINDLCGRDAIVLCDPTMAVSRTQWNKMEKMPSILDADEEYILTYFLGDRTKKYEEFIVKNSNENNLRVIHLFDVMHQDGYSISPQEFLYLIDHAKLVCTDSFHGTIFSIIFNTNFVTFPRIESGGSLESRLETLLKKFEFQSRDYRNIKNEEIFNTDFSKTEEILEKNKQDFTNYLKNIFDVGISGVKDGTRKLYNNKNECCGCNACESACPNACITMVRDDEGFSYPIIDESKCCHCNICKTVCPLKNKDVYSESIESECEIAHSLEPQIRMSSSSGGIFTEIANSVLDDGGYVIGAGFDENYKVKHQIIKQKDEIYKLKGSKYVQSEIGSVYKDIQELLNKDKLVYFSGTPCQVKGLYSYLGKKKYTNLITQDIICHGVPSPDVWEKYVSRYRNIRKVNFRDKTHGWHYFSLKIKYGNRTYVKRLDEDWYLKLFLDNTILRPSCYECMLKIEGSYADITLADCWNLNKITDQVIDSDKGLSLVFINTSKGKERWQYIMSKGIINSKQVNSQKAINSQESYTKSVEPNVRRAVFFELWKERDIDYMLKNWYEINLIKKIKRKYFYTKSRIYNMIRKF